MKILNFKKNFLKTLIINLVLLTTLLEIFLRAFKSIYYDGIFWIHTPSVNNIFDKNPPLNGKSINYVPGNANTYPSYYDPLGRYVFLNISKKFN